MATDLTLEQRVAEVREARKHSADARAWARALPTPQNVGDDVDAYLAWTSAAMTHAPALCDAVEAQRALLERCEAYLGHEGDDGCPCDGCRLVADIRAALGKVPR